MKVLYVTSEESARQTAMRASRLGATSKSLLVLAEPWYPGWTAKVNDTVSAEVLPVNGWMRGIVVPAGDGRVVLEYQPTGWRLGLWTSLFSCGLAIILWRLPLGRSSHA